MLLPARGRRPEPALGRLRSARGCRRPTARPGVDAAATACAPLSLRRAGLARAVLWALAGLTALGVAIRFASLGLQSYHHDEVITAARVIPGSFGHMLHEVKASESNPPLYYVLAWGWAKAFGTGEVGPALALGAVRRRDGPGRLPARARAGEPPRRPDRRGARRRQPDADLVLAGGPLLRAARLLLRALAALLRARAAAPARRATWRSGRSPRRSPSAATTSPSSRSAIEAAWLLVALRSRWRAVLPRARRRRRGRAGAAAAARRPDQPDPHRLDRQQPALRAGFCRPGVSFLTGETGHVIAEPPRDALRAGPGGCCRASRCCWSPCAAAARERRGGRARRWPSALGVVALAVAAALAGKDYVVERNLLPALVPLVRRGRDRLRRAGAPRLGAACVAALCAYWLAFDVYVDPHAEPAAARLPRPRRARLGPPRGRGRSSPGSSPPTPLQFYLDGRRRARLQRGRPGSARSTWSASPRLRSAPPRLPAAFRPVAARCGSSGLLLSATCRGARIRSRSTRCATCRPASARTPCSSTACRPGRERAGR